jgi:hypothetical protein
MKQKVYVVIGDSYRGISDSESWLEGVYFDEDKANTACDKLRERWRIKKIEENIPGFQSVCYYVTESEIE